MANVGASSSKQNQSNINESQRDTVFKKPSGYEVIRGGQGYSVITPKPTDVVVKKVYRGGGGGGGGGVVSSPTSPTGYTDVLNQPVSVKPSSQAVPSSNQLKSQIETRSRIEPLKDYGYVKQYKTSLSSGIKQTGQNVISNVKEFFGDREYKDTFSPLARSEAGSLNLNLKPLGFFSSPIDVLRFNPKSKSERIYDVNIQKGKEIETIGTTLTSKGKEYSSRVSKTAQEEYNRAFDIAQSSITAGSWNIAQGTDYLKGVQSSIETKYKTQIEEYGKGLQQEYSTSIGSIESKYEPKLAGLRYGTLDVGGTLAKGVPLAIETGIALSSPVGAGLIGLKEFSYGAKESDPYRIAGGLSMIGIPVGIQLSKLPREISQAQALANLEKQSFKFGEVRFSGNNDFSIIKGIRSSGGLTQEVSVAGKVLKSGDFFIQPQSKFTSNIGGTIESAWGGGLFKVKPQAYIGSQIGELGSKGLTLPISGLKTGEGFVTIGKGTIVTKMESFGVTDINKLKSGGFGFDSNKLSASFKSNIKSFDNQYTSNYFSGVSKKIGENLYLSKSGKADIGSIRINKLGLGFVDANMKDITFTRVIPKSGIKGSVEIEFSKSGLQGFTQIPKTSGVGLISSSLIQESKAGLIPKLVVKPSSFSGKGFGSSGSGLTQLSSGLKSKDIFSSGFSSRSIDLGSINVGLNTNTLSSSFVSSGIGSSFGSSLSSLPSSSLRQPQMQSQSLGQLQTSKLDLSMKSVIPQQITQISLTPSGFGGIGGFSGFGFPAIGLPSFGGGLGTSKKRVVSKKRKTKIAPSLTAELFDLRGALPKGGTFGISPFQLRKIPKGKSNPYATKF